MRSYLSWQARSLAIKKQSCC